MGLYLAKNMPVLTLRSCFGGDSGGGTLPLGTVSARDCTSGGLASMLRWVRHIPGCPPACAVGELKPRYSHCVCEAVVGRGHAEAEGAELACPCLGESLREAEGFLAQGSLNLTHRAARSRVYQNCDQAGGAG